MTSSRFKSSSNSRAMPASPEPCPGCESIQPFTLRTRPTDKQGVIEVFISCKTCPWEQTVRESTPKLEELLRKQAMLNRRIQDQRDRHGVESMMSYRQRRQLRDAIVNEERYVRATTN